MAKAKTAKKAAKKTKPVAKAAKKAAKPAKVAKKAKATDDDEKPAKKAGKVAKKAGKSKRKPLPTFAAPKEFKPHFLEVFVKTEKDGLLGSAAKATRYQGRYDPQAEDKKKADLASYDPTTLIGIVSRLSAASFATNPTKRLPANTPFRILMRVNRKSADGSLSIGIKEIAAGVPKNGVMKYKGLDKKDPYYRKLRKAARILPAAFKAVMMPPKRVRGKKVEADAE